MTAQFKIEYMFEGEELIWSIKPNVKLWVSIFAPKVSIRGLFSEKIGLYLFSEVSKIIGSSAYKYYGYDA